MNVMECIPYSRGRSIDPSSSCLTLLQNLPQNVERDVSKALELLRGQNLVFGDLREPNPLYLSVSDGGRVLLIDFDRVGLDGKSRYSACLNLEAGYCSAVERGQIMKKEHDYGNFEELLGRFLSSFSQK